jgi:hypothetical protein
MDEFKVITDVLQTTGAIGALVFFILGLVRGWWVMKSHHEDIKHQLQEMREDRDMWKHAALRGTDIAERSVDTVASAVGQRRLEARLLDLEAQVHKGASNG